ncbi:caspase, EACC1-associated type [Kitasatospora sp. NPDC054768]|uniref:caspase, EACC1-associated type n=1 Tax=Kitasatospora sp. NBC_01519 TaxID=2903576 RepID=UPI002F912BCD
MTAPEPLYDYARSRAVLVGAWGYRYLPAVGPATRNSLERMERLLTGPQCGWPAATGASTDRLQVVRSPQRRGSLPDELMRWFVDAEDVALFYFVGHGRLYGDELCLALAESPETGPAQKTTGLRFADVREALEESGATTKVIILDCCFSGQATLPGNSLATPDITDLTHCSGVITLAASEAYRTAWYEPDLAGALPQTYFTRYLIDAIESGVPGHDAGIPLDAAFAAASNALIRDRKPKPTQSVRHRASQFIIARSPNQAATSGNTAPTVDPEELYRAGVQLENAWDTEISDLPRIESLFRAAADAGHADAMTALGRLLEGRARARLENLLPKEVTDIDVDGAMYWYEKAANLGSSAAAYFLGLAYEDHRHDIPRALAWYEAALRKNDHNWAARDALDGLRDRLARGLGPVAGARRPAEPQSPGDQPPGQKEGPDVFSNRADEQGALIAKMIARQATPAEAAQAQTNFERWIAVEYEGNEHLALAFAVNGLAEACGGLRGEWGTLTDTEHSALLRFFTFLCLPTKDSADADAIAFRDYIRSKGTLQSFARNAIKLFGMS